ncbi:hypothetical protein SAY87_008779 [Trapa incisa]|uniref:Uncharacterized protein n=1 Tax=Trapa incisa TaxID=236973 RepID=A0AAN7JXN9_9MYRT|nr:hypothetical protein SAY87_008779 [Trapa incisa]
MPVFVNECCSSKVFVGVELGRKFQGVSRCRDIISRTKYHWFPPARYLRWHRARLIWRNRDLRLSLILGKVFAVTNNLVTFL